MTERNLIKTFMETAIARNPDLVPRLRPKCSIDQIRAALAKEVTGDMEPLFNLYSWSDGTDLAVDPGFGSAPDFEAFRSKTSFFAGSHKYVFLPLEMAVGHLKHLSASASKNRKLQEGVGRYFPVFWDGSTRWLAVDLKPSCRNRMMLIDQRAELPFRELYSSFEEFLEDAIRANNCDEPLSCFLGTSEDNN